MTRFFLMPAIWIRPSVWETSKKMSPKIPYARRTVQDNFERVFKKLLRRQVLKYLMLVGSWYKIILKGSKTWIVRI